ncbi:MAG: type II toxin-antitoxin system RelE/ParE family toxin [Phascolarctobacterium sp.]|nr:type II toxin-antitoxin system RelE/ParE family toxin [Phascolarctobacterium sp.]
MPNFKVEFYGKEDGTFPAEDFILKQPPKMRARIYQYIRFLEIKGNELREPYSKYLRDGIFELRTQQGNDMARVLYFFVVGRKVILTNGFIKKAPKTPNDQIELAKKYRADYERRQE